MNNIYNYNNFLTEATLDDSKKDVSYQLSRIGKEKAFKILNIKSDIDNFTIQFENTIDNPSINDKVLWIKPSSFNIVDFSKLKDEKLMIYKISSDDDINLEWAVAKKGVVSTMIKQLVKKGSSKRGNHFRETAFLIILSIEAYKKGFELDIVSNHGQVFMEYNEIATLSNRNPKIFNQLYYDFINDVGNKKIITNMIEHCKLLLNYLGEDIVNVSYVMKNNKENLINIIAKDLLKDEINLKKSIDKEGGLNLSEYGAYNIPLLTNISKWNPSDIWIVFDDKLLTDSSIYESYDINTLDDLNEFLYKSMVNRDGIVGVSLKQSKLRPALYSINSDNRKTINKFDDFEVKSDRKTSNIDFSFKQSDKEWRKGSGIDIRTFDSSNKSAISIEIKGSKGSGYVSGKAGSMINHLLPEDLVLKKEIIQKGVDKSKIREELRKLGGLNINNKSLRNIFSKDIRGEGILNNFENSRLQSIIFIDWLNSLPNNLKNRYITDIVEFGKSESSWSAPHLVLK